MNGAADISTLVARLRASPGVKCCAEAANEIERLRAALRRVVDVCQGAEVIGSRMDVIEGVASGALAQE